MFDETTHKWAVSNWSMVVLLGMTFIVVGAFVWWLERNFGPRIAVMTLGLLGGSGFIIAGMALTQRSNRIAMENFTDALHELAGPQKEIWKVVGHDKRLDLAQFNHQARLQTMDERVINDLANKRAKAVVDAERRKWDVEQELRSQQARTWDADDIDADAEDWGTYQ